MRHLLLAGVAILLAVSMAVAGDATTSSAQSREPWCKPGWICLRADEVAKDAEEHYDMQERLLQYKRRASRFGLTIGPGIGAASLVDDNFDVRWAGTTGVFLVWGIRFP